MPDPATIGAIASVLAGLRDLIGKIRDQSVRAELQAALISLQAETMRVQQDNMTLVNENRQLKEDARERVDVSDYTLDGNAYRRDGRAYCIRCMEEDHKARTLAQRSKYRETGECPTCKTIYDGIFQAQSPVSLSELQRRKRRDGPEGLFT